jgi:hypothetical protein
MYSKEPRYNQYGNRAYYRMRAMIPNRIITYQVLHLARRLRSYLANIEPTPFPFNFGPHKAIVARGAEVSRRVRLYTHSGDGERAA